MRAGSPKREDTSLALDVVRVTEAAEISMGRGGVAVPVRRTGRFARTLTLHEHAAAEEPETVA
jgi:hypothetical protein